MSLWKAYLDDINFSFRKHKEMAEQALGQLRDDEFFPKPGEHLGREVTPEQADQGAVRAEGQEA